ncbi:MAG TPA: lanthionine synthetase C family protein [Polyangia bacterium]|jgi:lantibiotic modifying enzyme|nr:lanthionine synthetase C family protein [Polyangia bacterium]
MWRPLLTGTTGETARDAAHAIAAALHDPMDWPARHAHQIAILHAYVGDPECAGAFMERAMSYVADTPLSPALFGGVCGIAWALNHLDPDSEDAMGSVDELVLKAIADTSSAIPYDLISGLVGLGVYALARMPRASAQTIVRAIIVRLDDLATRDVDGVCWLTLPSDRTASGAGHYDLGIAHGAAGVIGFLARVRRAGLDVERVTPMLAGALRWLTAHRLEVESSSRFASKVALDGTMDVARSAWCYGDPGVALSLLAASACGCPTARDVALETAVTAASRDPGRSGVLDAGLCHGAAGLGHIFNRLHQATGAPRLREAATYWFTRCLSLRQAGSGIGGFQSFLPSEDGRVRWADDASLLTGATGIALALLAASDEIEPRWDAMLLMDLDVGSLALT